MQKLWLIVWIAASLSLGLAACANSNSTQPWEGDPEEGELDGDLEEGDTTDLEEGDTDPLEDGDLDESDQEPDGSDGDESDSVEPRLVFPDAVENWSITYTDDVDPTKPGMQADIRVKAENFTATAISLVVNGAAPLSENLVSGDEVTFKGVDLTPGANVLVASAWPNETGEAEAALIEATASLSLNGCRLVFVAPLTGATLSDHTEGSDCATTCGDDLDCAAPNLQYNVVLNTENVAATQDVELSIAGVRTTAKPVDGVVTFAAVSLPHDPTLPLAATVDLGGGLSCTVEEEIAVSLQCSCHLVVEPLPKAVYNLEDEDQSTDEGFQRRYAISSDNCVDGSRLHVLLNGDDTPLTLASGTAALTLTLPDTATGVQHTLNVTIVESGTGREGAAGPYKFRVDRLAPRILGFTDLHGNALLTLTKADDLNANLDDGIQIAIKGTSEGLEDGRSVDLLSVTLMDDKKRKDVAPVATTTVNGNAFTFSSITLPVPASYVSGSVTYKLSFAASDAAGNPAVSDLNLSAIYEEPSIVFSGVAGREPASDMVLAQSDDADATLAGLQIRVVAHTRLVLTGQTASLSIDGGAPQTANVDTLGDITWTVTMGSGAHTLTASVPIIAGGLTVATDPLAVTVDASTPSVAFIDPAGDNTYVTDGAWIKTSTINALIASDAGEGRLVTLFLGTTQLGDPVALDAQGRAAFTNVALAKRKYSTLTLKAQVATAAGNPGAAQISVHRDTQTPAIEVNVTGAPTLATTDNIAVSVSVTEDALAEMATRKAVLELFDTTGGANSSLGKVDVALSAAGAGGHVYPFIANGSYRVEATFTDRAGNAGTGSATFTVDMPCYQVQITAPAAGAVYGPTQAALGDMSKGVCVPVTVASSDAPANTTTANLYLDGSTSARAVCVISGGGCSFTDTTCQNLGLTGVNFGEGAHTFQVKLTNGSTSCPSNILSLDVDFTAPTLALESPVEASPILFNTLSADADPGTAFASAFRYATDASEAGRSATLTVKNGTATVGSYNAVVGEDGKIRFSSVALTGTGFAEGASLTLTLTLTDAAGNTATKSNDALVDLTAPEFLTTTPTPGSSLSSLDDEDSRTADIFDLKMVTQIRGGVPGTPVYVQVTPENGTPYALGPFTLVDKGNNQGEVTVRGTFAEGNYSFVLTHTDNHGNQATSTPIYYRIKFITEIHLLDWDLVRIENTSATWTYTQDIAPATAGFQARFKVSAVGIENGAFVYLCSDVGLEDGSEPYGRCASNTSYIAVDRQLMSSDTARFSSVSLRNERVHHLFVEASDSVGNTADSLKNGLATLTLDSLRPALAAGGLKIMTNQAANDTNPTVDNVLGISEGTLVAGGLSVDVELTLSDATTDAVSADLFLNGTSLTGNNRATVTLTGGVYKAVFTGITLPNGTHSGTGSLLARLWDARGNVSDDTAAASLLAVEVDTIKPKVSIIDTTNATLYQAQCSSTDGSQNCLHTVKVRVEKQAGELSGLLGGKVVLSLGATTRQITLDEDGSSVDIEFTDFPFPQGTPGLGAVATDPAGNESTPATLSFTVDSLAPTVALLAPSYDPTYDASANDDTTCGSGGGLNDLKLRRCDWSIEVAGMNRDASVEVQWRYAGDTDFATFGNSAAVWSAINGGATTHAVAPLDFTRDTNPSVIEVRLRATEATTGNIYTSGVVRTVTLNFAPAYAIQLYALPVAKGVSKLIGDGTMLNRYYADSTTTDSVFHASLRVVASTELNGETVQLSVNDASFGAPLTAVIASGVANFTGVPLTEGPTRNTLYTKIVTQLNDTITNSYSNILADSKAPTLSFSIPAVGSVVNYAVAQDNDGTTGNGVVPKSSVAPTILSSGIENDQIAVLSATDDVGSPVALGGTTTASFQNGSASFTAVRLPNTAAISGNLIKLSVTVSDLAGNQATTTGGTPQVRVDDDPPADVATLKACIGATTGSAAAEIEAASCASACNGNSARCDARLGNVTLAFTAPSANSSSGSASVMPSSYEIRWAQKLDTDTPCASGIDWNATTNTPATATLTVDALVGVGSTQTAVVSGVEVNTNTAYCFWARAVDALGNKSATAFAGATTAKTERAVRLHVTTVQNSLSPLSKLAYHLRTGDLNGDGLSDFAVADWDTNDNRGRVYVYYGQSDLSQALATQVFEGAATGDYFGTGLDIGDINGDGVDDLVVGAKGVEPRPWIGDGAAYIYFGVDGGSLPTTPDVTLRPDTNRGDGYGHSFGQHVEILDMDGAEDGAANPASPGHFFHAKDVAISTNADNVGDLYVFRGRGNWSGVGLPAYIQDTADFIIQREAASSVFPEQLGIFMSHGDFDADGKADLLISQLDYYDAYPAFSPDRVWLLWGNYTGASPLEITTAGDIFAKFDAPATSNAEGDWGNYLYGIPSTSGGTRDEALILDYGGGFFNYYPDLATFGTGITPTFSLYTIAGTSNVRPWAGMAGDFNGDGKNDAAISGTGTVRLYWGSATGLDNTRYLNLNGLTGTSAYRALGGADFDGDGRADLVIVNATSGAIYILH